MRLHNLSIFLCAALAVVLYSCSEDTVNNNTIPPLDTSTFVYPFTIGSTWNYNRTFSAENIRPDSILHHFKNWPFRSSGNITIIYDTVINGITTRCFHERYTEVQENDTMTWHNRYYYGNFDSALVCFAFRSNSGGSGIPFSANANIKFEKNGNTFNNVKEIINYYENPYQMISPPDSLNILNPPAIILKYPVTTGVEWVSYYVQGIPYSIKKYISFNSLFIGLNPVTCIKTEKRMQIFGEDVNFYDYYSKFGQLKKDYLYKDMLVTTIHNPDGVGYVDIRDLYNVTSYTIVNP